MFLIVLGRGGADDNCWQAAIKRFCPYQVGKPKLQAVCPTRLAADRGSF
jgi:hypothetical protein